MSADPNLISAPQTNLRGAHCDSPASNPPECLREQTNKRDVAREGLGEEAEVKGRRVGGRGEVGAQGTGWKTDEGERG